MHVGGMQAGRQGDGMKRIATPILRFALLSSWAMSKAFSTEHRAYEKWH